VILINKDLRRPQIKETLEKSPYPKKFGGEIKELFRINERIVVYPG